MNPNNLENGTITTAGSTGGVGMDLGTRWGHTMRVPPPSRPGVISVDANPFEDEEPELLRDLDQLLRAANSSPSAGQTLRSFRSGFSQDFTREYDEQTMNDIAGVMKERHLSKSERAAYHQPKNDWKESPKGDVCKNASTLEVEDIITKYR